MQPLINIFYCLYNTSAADSGSFSKQLNICLIISNKCLILPPQIFRMNLSEKHQHILVKAEELFAQKGYEGSTVRDIAQAAGVNLAMISYYFGSKEKLIETLFAERMGSIRLRIESVVNNDAISPFQKLEILIDQHIERVFERQSFYKVMLHEQMLNQNEAILLSIKKYKLEFITLIKDVIEQGKKQELFKGDTDIMLLLTSMTGTVMQMLINKNYYKEFNHHEKMKDDVYESMLKQKLSAHIKSLFKATLGYEQ
jgi:AcrR family transcriptional regulator